MPLVSTWRSSPLTKLVGDNDVAESGATEVSPFAFEAPSPFTPLSEEVAAMAVASASLVAVREMRFGLNSAGG